MNQRISKSRLIIHGIFVILFLISGCSLPQAQSDKSRLLIMADMGNETDEEQQMVHMLMYSNMYDLEGLVACSGLYLHSGIKSKFRSKVHPELFTKLINGYSNVLENLKQHAKGWPDPAVLHSIVKPGSDVFGIDAVKEGNANEGSKLIAAAILKKDPRKLYIVANAGTNTLAQALVDLDKDHSDDEMKKLCRNIIVYENGAQDNAGAWIANKYPHIYWHRSNRQTYAYGGPDKGKFGSALGPYTWRPYKRDSDGQDQWANEHIKNNHGALGTLFPRRNRFIEGGGTAPWMGLAFHGLSDPQHLYWGGQSGRFSRTKHKNIWSRHKSIKNDEQKYGDFYMYEADSESETWTDPVEQESFSGYEVPVWRFRRAMFNDFRARMDWCVKPYDQANHNPIAAFGDDRSDSIIHLKARSGQIIDLDATASKDPDGDSLHVTWWVYRQAGTYDNDINISHATSAKTKLKIPDDASGKEIHLILEIQDDNEIVSMYDFRRIVINVGK